jgi:hypothetical protein
VKQHEMSRFGCFSTAWIGLKAGLYKRERFMTEIANRKSEIGWSVSDKRATLLKNGQAAAAVARDHYVQ